MSDRLNLRTREELRAKIEATVAASPATGLSTDNLVAELQADAEELGARGVLLGLSAALGEKMGAAVFADITGRADVSDAELARRFDVTPQAVSKTMRRVRRNLGLPLRVPNNARHRVGGAN